MLISEAAEPLIGKSLYDSNLSDAVSQAAEIVKIAVTPITDMRGSADQRRHLSKVLTERTLNISIERAIKSMEGN